MAKNGMKRSFVLLPLLLLGGALPGAAQAQQGSFDAHVADIGLLQAKQVQTDVGITTAERDKMNVAASAYRDQVAAYGKQLKALGQSTPDQAKMRGMFEVLKNQVLKVLTPAQIRRVREITLQRLGMISLTDDVVAKQVGLSPAQVGRLKAAYQAGRTKFMAVQQQAQQAALPVMAPYKDRKPKTAAEAQALQKEVAAKLTPVRARFLPQLQAVGKATDASMLAVLTPAQKAAWTALKGKPFVAK